jgi:aryl-alcohol dehydrogenase-like predicted oxidoreductase
MTQRPDVYADFVDDRVFDSLEGLERLAAERETSMAGLSLGWLLANPDVTAVVVGPGRPDQLDVVAQALAHPLDAGERELVSGLFAFATSWPSPTTPGTA